MSGLLAQVAEVTEPGWPAVVLVALNVVQVCTLAWIASRGSRRRRTDARRPSARAVVARARQE